MTNATVEIDQLRRVPLFADCSDSELVTVAGFTERRVVPARSILLTESETAPELLVVVQGVADVLRCGSVIATIRAGEFVGETSVIEGQRATATVVATTDMTLLAIPAAHARTLLRQEGVAHRMLERVISWLRETPSQGPVRAAAPRRVRKNGDDPVDGWGSITVAEQRVIDLVALGQANPEVAETLFISRHTVESHLKSIYRKLGVSSRTELAIEAVQRGGN